MTAPAREIEAADSVSASADTAARPRPATLADLLAAADFPTGRPAWTCWACGGNAWAERPAEAGGGYFCAVCHPATLPVQPAEAMPA